MKIQTLILFCLTNLINLPGIRAADTNQPHFNGVVLNTNYASLLKQFVLGQPQSNISVGISKSSNPTNIFVCLVYVGQTNSSQSWIAPPQFQRAEYYLYDASGNVIPYLAYYRPANKIYKTISEVPKDVHNVSKGLMWPPFTMPYEQISLNKVFQIEHGGDYKLVVKGRIMKINDDSTLSVVVFPAVSLLIYLKSEEVSVPNK
jgi:hypothetical protein